MDMMPLAIKIEIATNIIVLSNKLHGSHANLLEKLKTIILSNNEISWQCTNLESLIGYNCPSPNMYLKSISSGAQYVTL